MALSLKGPESHATICTWSLYVCACLIRKVQSIKLMLCIFLIIVFSLFLFLLLSTGAHNEVEMSEFVLLNETEDLLMNITGKL